MATLGQIAEVITEQLRERVDRLVSAVENDTPEFTQIASDADAVAEFADTIADIYTDLERRLFDGLEGSDRNNGGSHSQEAPKQERPRRPQSQSGQSEPANEDVTKEELLEQARELHVEGRSSMTKEELSQAVQAEESVTREELLERARAAQIEGRSSMTKEELREALHQAGA